MMSVLDAARKDKKVLISDGAWGTELARLGMESRETPEALNLKSPELVRQVASSYVEAGSDIILTNTFGGSPLKLAKAGLGDQCFEINRTAAETSKAAAAGRALVFASIGPTGELVEPLGDVAEAQMFENFAEQVKGLVAGGADGIVIETMLDLTEAKAALRAVKEHSSLPVVACMTFDKGPKGYATMMGVKPERAASELAAAGADAVGSNCGQGIQNLIEVARIMRTETELPLWIKPNAGLPKLVEGKTVFLETAESMVQHFSDLVEAGASIIGGCCGTTPDHIRAFVKARDRMDR